MSRRPAKSDDREEEDDRTPAVRIIGGKFRGRKLAYSGSPRTRPMKDRVRESLFDLIGPQVRGTHAIDLFAGTGALGLEALSRGAQQATLIEQHFPTADIIRQNVETLSAAAQCEVIGADAFRWIKRMSLPTSAPWLVLCSPPFEFFESRSEEMHALISYFLEHAPAGSTVAVEMPDTCDSAALPESQHWDVRSYPPAKVAILRVTGLRSTDLPVEELPATGPAAPLSD